MAILSSSRGRAVAVGVLSASVLATVAAAIIGLSGAHPATVADPPRSAAAQVDLASTSPSASPSSSDSRAPSPSASPSRKPVPPKKKTPPPSAKPVTVAKPPPPPPAGPPPGPGTPSPGASCPRLTGPVAPRADVAAAMSAATGRSYRPTLSLDDTNPPAITVRLPLVEGIGWEESGWQSTIVSCDGGLGAMQVMPDTATWMNEKYATHYDRATLTGNVCIATGYLAWLTRYFGDRYFNGNYSLAGDPDKIVLLDMVISAYQAGFGGVDNAVRAGRDLPNRWYVDTVEGFMTSQPWTAG